MKQFALIALISAAAVFCARQSRAQGTLAPLFLFTNGNGSISPLQDGQLLQVGQSYDLTAVPDSGFLFSSWQPIDIFIFTEVVLDPSGNPSTNSSTVPSPIPDFIYTADLTFTMQDELVILNEPGVRTITESSGWQANFVQVPEPSGVALILAGFAGIVMLRSRRGW